jgi:hypothetical protein
LVAAKDGFLPLFGVDAAAFLAAGFLIIAFLFDTAFLTFDLVAMRISFERLSTVDYRNFQRFFAIVIRPYFLALYHAVIGPNCFIC